MILARDCKPGEACYIPATYQYYQVEDYGNITPTTGQSKVDAIKNEIMQRGPVTCDIEDTEAFKAYTSGVFCV
jgi:hypothetical protein